MNYTLPMIALRGMVVLPNTVISLDLGRSKSILALNKCIDDSSKIFLVAQKSIAVENPTKDDIYQVGIIATIIQVIAKSNDNVRIIIKGEQTAKIDEYLDTEKIFLVNASTFEYIDSVNAEVEALLRRTREQLALLAVNSSKISKETLLKISNIEDANEFTNIVASDVFYKDSDKQEILEIVNTKQRLEFLYNILVNETELARIDKKIATRVKRQIDEGQKEYYLKEQIRAISKELGEDEDEITELDNKIKKAKMPSDIADKAYKEVRRLSKMSPSSPDAGVIRTYVEWLTDLEWKEQTKDNKDLDKAREILDADHYGLEKIKERIIEYLAVMQLTNGLNGPILCFVGPPGVGKTSVVKSIARALNRKYVRMSLGGVRDEAEIRGHRRTYIGAIPGKVIYMMKQAKCTNPVLLFDEIDKMSSDFRGDPASAMLEVLDPEQNFSFVDHYLEVPYDLSKVLFVCTANTVDSIPPALLDRMEIIELSGYSAEEKLEIASKFLIPKQEKMHGLKENSLTFTEEGLRQVIAGYTRESGVRALEREIATVCRKVALKIVKGQAQETIVKKENIEDYLGLTKFKNDFLDIENEIGSATGLAWTVVGGTTLTIDVTLFEGKGEILLTGMLGDVMKESARTAISLVRSRAKEYNIPTEAFAKTDIHIHIPEGAIHKDGPSAGITLATAIMSAFSSRPVNKKIAMTGEVTLRGKVLPIGGLKEKSLAGYRAGIRKIIVPKDNENDLKEIPKEVLDDIEIVLVSDISQVFDTVLL
ncbi:MAG: endopeptidase La [Clostridia bacterium]